MQRRQPLFAFVILCVAILWGVSSAVAQVNTATLSGTVIDPQGLAVRGAKISVTLLATGSERSVNVDESGHYTFVGLVPGIYKLRVHNASNFARYERPPLQITAREQPTATGTLQLVPQNHTT